jgi:hypothetical protein
LVDEGLELGAVDEVGVRRGAFDPADQRNDGGSAVSTHVAPMRCMSASARPNATRAPGTGASAKSLSANPIRNEASDPTGGRSGNLGRLRPVILRPLLPRGT